MSWKILIIDDQISDKPRYEKCLGQWLKSHLVFQPFAQSAINYVQQDTQREIIAVLLDLLLNRPDFAAEPQRLENGQELRGTEGGCVVASIIKHIRPDLPIIAVSVHPNPHDPNFYSFYPKEDLFNRGMCGDLRDLLENFAINFLSAMYYPSHWGKLWKEKWGPKYLRFRDDPNFPNREKKIGDEAKKDFEMLRNGQIRGSYRAFRTTRTLENVLIARRVLFASALSHLGRDGGIKWGDVCRFLGFDYDQNALNNFMHSCGIAWGGILNRSTLLKEEIDWIVEMQI
jgi:hypothetical protein